MSQLHANDETAQAKFGKELSVKSKNKPHLSMGNIIFIGMPGAGKSTLGVVLAKRMNKEFIDTDLLIQQQEGVTLQEYIDEYGTAAFLHLENDVLCGISPKNAIIATGGSAVYSPEAMAHLSQLGVMVNLKLTLDQMKERIVDLETRGVVMQGDCKTLDDVYAERAVLYKRYEDISLDVGELTVGDAANRLLGMLQ